MKRRILSLTAFCLLSLMSSPALVTPAHAETSAYLTLTQGMSGEAVKTVQQQLQTLGYFTYPTITGYYGSITKQAVKDFQWAYGLTVDGIAGPITQRELAHAIVKKRIVNDSYNYLNTRYLWGGTTPAGFDCSGFIYYMFNKHGVSLPRYSSSALFAMGKPIAADKLQPGDLVFFSISQSGTVQHVGIYLGGGKFISPLNSKGVYVQTIFTNPYWSSRYLGAKRIY